MKLVAIHKFNKIYFVEAHLYNRFKYITECDLILVASMIFDISQQYGWVSNIYIDVTYQPCTLETIMKLVRNQTK